MPTRKRLQQKKRQSRRVKVGTTNSAKKKRRVVAWQLQLYFNLNSLHLDNKNGDSSVVIDKFKSLQKFALLIQYDNLYGQEEYFMGFDVYDRKKFEQTLMRIVASNGITGLRTDWSRPSLEFVALWS